MKLSNIKIEYLSELKLSKGENVDLTVDPEVNSQHHFHNYHCPVQPVLLFFTS